MRSPKMHTMKVTAPMMRDEGSVFAKEYPAIVKPTERASIDVAIPLSLETEFVK